MRSVDLATSTHAGGALVTAPTAQEEIPDWSRSLLDRLRPAAIISIERLGPNTKGIVHGATGLAGWDPLVDMAPLFSAAAERRIFSVGIGDAGNEIGFGAITEIKLFEPKGLKLVGPLPAEVQNYTSYAAALMTGAPSPQAAKAFLAFLGSAEAKQAFAAAGIE